MKSSQIDWIVRVDKAEFGLTESQYQLLKKASLSGKTMVWFDSFVISIPHISYMEKVKKPEYPNMPQLPDVSVVDMSKKIKKIREKLRI